MAAVAALGARHILRLHDSENIVLDAQLAEDRFLLREVAHSEPRAAVHRLVGGVLAVESDAATVRLDEADDHVESRRLAGTIRAEEANDLAGAHGDLDPIDYRAAIVDLLQTVRVEQEGLARLAVRAGRRIGLNLGDRLRLC